MTRLATADERADHDRDLLKHEPRAWDGTASHARVQNAEREPRYPLLRQAVTDLKLADVVELFEGPFGTGVVRQITKEQVIISRPYGVSGDFSYSGGVSFSVGVEECKYFLSSHHTFTVFQRKELR